MDSLLKSLPLQMGPETVTIEDVGGVGSWVLFIVFLIFLVSAIAMGVLCFRKDDNALLTDRMHHYITFKIVAIAGLSYYAMSGGHGVTPVLMSEGHYRMFYYARYIDWLFTTPLLLTDLILLGDLTLHHTTRIIFNDVVMILAGLIAAFSSGWHKWGWYTIGCIFMLFIFYDLLVVTRAKVFARSQYIGKLFTSLAAYLIGLWLLYPIVWGLGEGAGVISLDTEVVLYGILDVLAKAVFGWILLLGVGKISIDAEAAAKSGEEVEGGQYSSLNTNA